MKIFVLLLGVLIPVAERLLSNPSIIIIMTHYYSASAFPVISLRPSRSSPPFLFISQEPPRLSRCRSSTRHARTPKSKETDFQSTTTIDTGMPSLPRRLFLQSFATVAAVALPSSVVQAGLPEIDANTGSLYSPRTEMMSGGSKAARGGIPSSGAGGRLKPGQVLQTVYETRFIAYLSRFLLNFDPSAHAWWVQQGFADSWEPSQEDAGDDTLAKEAEQKFAEFAESVEVGLADYFVGPYGSYSSVAAAKAGILAAQPVKSAKPLSEPKTILDSIFPSKQKISGDNSQSSNAKLAKNGILNLYALLKARYNSVAAKKQLAILFSFISSPQLQPVNEIRALLGEADNACVSQVEIVRKVNIRNEASSRTSPRRGGGYSLSEPPTITVETPPALGDQYCAAKLEPIMAPTSRVLRVKVIDGGSGYIEPPTVTILGYKSTSRPCQASAILDRHGRVESILVLDPGYGYGGSKEKPPRVQIGKPTGRPSDTSKAPRTAKAIAQLEYEIVGVKIVDGGNGYVKTEPPVITVSEPDTDPDWFVDVQEIPSMRMIPFESDYFLRLQVSEMKFPDGNVAFSLGGTGIKSSRTLVNDELIQRLQRDPLELIPSSVRPELREDVSTGNSIYVVVPLARIPQFVAVMDARYRATDPIFGNVGRVPVTKGAAALSASEYGRLALSGAVCTVIVRTALNPLELIKTKIQLENDEELLEYARQSINTKVNDINDDLLPENGREAAPEVKNNTGLEREPVGVITVTKTETVMESRPVERSKEKVGTIQLLKASIALRGVGSLFQSADITFLASLAFGSFGFGATELFRRSIVGVFSRPGASLEGNEVALLLAASLATVVTAAVASPLELLRVRSMGLVEPEEWTTVLNEFVNEKSNGTRKSNETLKPRDLLPLWAGFAPTLSRELPFAVAKFLTFDILASFLIDALNSRLGEGALPVQVGVGPVGLGVSAFSGAVAGIAGAIVSHPADLVLTKTSASKKRSPAQDSDKEVAPPTWIEILRELITKEGGVANIFVGLPARSTFFFLVIGLQFFLYDYVKSLLQVGSDDLSLVLDVFYAVREGLVDQNI